MGGQLLLYGAIFAAVAVALLARLPGRAHAALGLAALLGATYGWQALGFLGALVPALAALVAVVQIGARLLADRRADFSAEESAMLAGPLAGLGRARARLFLDQGLWMDGRARDVLTREGQPAAHLYYLATGEAAVMLAGRRVGTLGPGQLIGEATVLNGEPATATVSLDGPSRLWCAPGRPLKAFLDANPDARHALDHGFTLSLRDKLHAMNRRTAEGEATA